MSTTRQQSSSSPFAGGTFPRACVPALGAELAKQVATRKGISEEEAATLIVKASIARRVKKRTGKNPAKVYSFKKR